jgi:hypothetical protein
LTISHKNFADEDTRLELLDSLDQLVTDAHDSWKRAQEDLTMLKFDHTQFQSLGPMTFKAGSSGYLLDQTDHKNGLATFALKKNEANLAIYEHLVTRRIDDGQEQAPTDQDDQEDQNEPPEPNFNNIEDFVAWAKTQKAIFHNFEEMSDVKARTYCGDLGEEVDPSSLFSCVHGVDWRVRGLQRDFQKALGKYLDVVNFVGVVRRELEGK